MIVADHIPKGCFDAHFVQEHVVCMDVFYFIYYLPRARLSLVLSIFLFSPLPQDYHSYKMRFV